MSDSFRTCEVCGRPGAQPYYTRAIRNIKGVTLKDRRFGILPNKDYQPRWRCREHKPLKVVKPV